MSPAEVAKRLQKALRDFQLVERDLARAVHDADVERAGRRYVGARAVYQGALAEAEKELLEED